MTHCTQCEAPLWQGNGDPEEGYCLGVGSHAENPTTTIRRSQASDWSGEYAELAATLPSGRTVSIDAWAREGDREPRINWGGIGSVSPADAAAYAALIAEAAALAPTLTPARKTR